ncbi:MAG: tetratricopeptide repeat protein [Candidatus Methylomirabilales bacterium]
MIRLLLIVLLVVGQTATAWAGAFFDFQKGRQAAQRGEYDLAVRYYTRAIQAGEFSQKNLAITLNNRGNVYKKKGLYDRAIKDYDAAIRLKPDLAYAFNNRGNAYGDKGLYDRAIKDYDAAIRLEPDYVDAFFNRGNAYRDKGLYDRAIKDYGAAIRLKPDFVLAYRNRASTYSTKGLYDRAIKDYNKAVRLKPDFALAYEGRGNTRFYLGHFSEAVRDHERSLSIDPSDIYSALWLYLARERSRQDGRHELARNAGKADLNGWPGPVVSLFLGKTTPQQVLAAAKDSDQRKQREQECEAFFYVGQYYLLRGNRGESARLFRKALDTGITGFYEYSGAKVELKRLGN